jgi:hypothetical protein
MNAFAHASSAPVGPELDGRRILAAVIDLALVVLGGVVLVTLFGTLTGAEDPHAGPRGAGGLGALLLLRPRVG